MKAFSFRSTLVAWGIFLLLVVGFVAMRAGYISPRDQQKYNKAAAEQLEKHKLRKVGVERHLTKHERFGVVKRMWLSDRQPRLQIELQGTRSEIDLSMKKSEARLIETFHDVQGIIQQELFYKDEAGKEYVFTENGELKKRGDGAEKEEIASVEKEKLIPMQRFRYFEADHAVYDYQTHTLIGYDVNFWIYSTEGHELVQDRTNLWPESSGTATSMTVCHEGTLGTMQFAAENLTMQVTPEW